MNPSGKHVFLTGAGKRLGRAIAEKLIPFKIKLTAHYRSSEKEAGEIAALAKKSGGDGHAVAADLSKLADVTKAVAAAEKKFGAIDILVCSASDFYPIKSLECTDEQWDAMLDVNLKGQFFLAQAALKQMSTRGGTIVLLTDTSIHHPYPNHLPYLVSKAGLEMMGRSLAKEYAPKVRVNSVSPGPVLAPDHYTEERKAFSSRNTLFQRWGTPEDVAWAVQFLVENDYVTGYELKVDGGRSI